MSNMFRVVIDGKTRYCFTGVSPDITLSEVTSNFPVDFPFADCIGTFDEYTVDLEEKIDGRWRLVKRLHGDKPETRSFGDVVRDSLGFQRPYKYDPDVAAPLVNPEPMKPDPILEELDQYGLPAEENYNPSIKAEDQVPDFYPPYPTGTPVPNLGRSNAANSLRIRAANKRREADNLDQLAKVADELKPGSPEENALWDLINGVR